VPSGKTIAFGCTDIVDMLALCWQNSNQSRG